MRRLIAVLLLVAACAPGPVEVDVVRVIDGDTIVVDLPRELAGLGPGEVRVRLAGVDTPELFSPKCAAERRAAAAARDYLKGFVGARVRLADARPGQYEGRIIARVLLPDGRDAADRLIAAGLGRPYNGGVRESWCPSK